VIAFLAFLMAATASLQAEDARLVTLSWRLQTANAALCPGQRVIGMTIHARSQYARDVQRQLALGDRPVVAAVAAGSAVDRAGVHVGDIVMAVDGRDTPTVAENAGYAPIGATVAMLETYQNTLTIQRGDMVKTVSPAPEKGCASWIQIVPGRSINAQADGRYVQINAGMLDFVANDDELATVVAHELAHNVLKHRAMKTRSRQAEYEADRLGVWLMARAGYTIDAVLPFWTRFEKRTNAGIFADGTHPSSKKRLAAIAAAVAALKAQRGTGEALIPPSQDEKAR
jgi:beta-barrel assembly-enhancing protease